MAPKKKSNGNERDYRAEYGDFATFHIRGEEADEHIAHAGLEKEATNSKDNAEDDEVASENDEEDGDQTDVEDLIKGDLKDLHRSTLVRVAEHYSSADLAKAVNAEHGTEWTTQKAYDRIRTAVKYVASHSGKTFEEAWDEFGQTRKANGVKKG